MRMDDQISMPPLVPSIPSLTLSRRVFNMLVCGELTNRAMLSQHVQPPNGDEYYLYYIERDW